ncbi:hypothetical protein [Carboxylicivirga sp. M1479]|uniref:hypothetical protein n=1 Tax=Carboxylicivirga sp. M1479 TaxID=2594476 RepID=UPI001177AAB5|nr:hypothetical protein [Carboxylicivirga sp. M1479]TRX65813.1 hypothetical protein FNN09_17070 [Carboxylicivirga sp. M1479]
MKVSTILITALLILTMSGNSIGKVYSTSSQGSGSHVMPMSDASTSSKKQRILALKQQLSDKLDPLYVDEGNRQSGFVGTKGVSYKEIIYFKYASNEETNLDVTIQYKVNFSNVEKVELNDINDNTKDACGIEIVLKKKRSCHFVRHSPTYTKGKKDFISFKIPTSYKRQDMIDSYNIIKQLVAECQ